MISRAGNVYIHWSKLIYPITVDVATYVGLQYVVKGFFCILDLAGMKLIVADTQALIVLYFLCATALFRDP